MLTCFFFPPQILPRLARDVRYVGYEHTHPQACHRREGTREDRTEGRGQERGRQGEGSLNINNSSRTALFIIVLFLRISG